MPRNRLSNARNPCALFQIPPLVVTNFFESLLEKVDTVLCGGREWQVKYSKDTKMLSGLLPIMREYEVKIRDTIFFTVARDGESVVKIFRRDGTEIRYCKAVVEDGKVQEPFLQREEVSHVEVIGESTKKIS